ncbi:MAG: DinB family protein [Actinobacteria bacterium]|nr:DinB family protein [Actinomycetota bacterium]MBU1494575.1 DinB family protein [Actinomycetota bacterium]MBU1865505.1 DinB family protein [Actinomycetota bacterium]
MGDVAQDPPRVVARRVHGRAPTLRVLRELAQHAGHADVLREKVSRAGHRVRELRPARPAPDDGDLPIERWGTRGSESTCPVAHADPGGCWKPGFAVRQAFARPGAARTLRYRQGCAA